MNAYGSPSIEIDRLTPLRANPPPQTKSQSVPSFEVNMDTIMSIGNGIIMVLSVISGIAAIVSLYEKFGGDTPDVLKDFKLPNLFD